MEGYVSPSGRDGYRFLTAEATSNLAAAMSVFFPKVTDTLPTPLEETDVTFLHPSKPARTPSILDVTSDSSDSDEAPARRYETLIVCPGSDGLYCTLSRGIDTIPTAARATAISSTEKDDMPPLPPLISSCKWNNTMPAERTN